MLIHTFQHIRGITQKKERGREVEKTTTIEFLRSLNEAVTGQINKAKGHVPVLTIDSARNNFVDNEEVKSKLLQMVADAMPQGNLSL